ncbi:MAG: hypothetical protein ACP5QU_08880 [Anaerolineae bacterium]
MEELIIRVGTFFILIGFYLLVLFIASDFAKMTDFDYLFLAVLAMGIGWVLQRRRPPPPPAGRFSSLRKLREKLSKKQSKK